MKGAYKNNKRYVCNECGKPQLIQALICTEKYIEEKRHYVRSYACKSKHIRSLPYVPREGYL